MSLITKLESVFSLTRGDVTIALFIAGAALFGFIYLTFLDERMPERERLDLLRLQSRYDSVVEVRSRAPLAQLERDLNSDSLPTVQAVLADVPAEESPSKRGGAKSLPQSPVNLNSAAKPDLVRLPGVGEKTADAIIERRKHIPFRRTEDLMDVKGIGEKKFAKIKPYVKVR